MTSNQGIKFGHWEGPGTSLIRAVDSLWFLTSASCLPLLKPLVGECRPSGSLSWWTGCDGPWEISWRRGALRARRAVRRRAAATGRDSCGSLATAAFARQIQVTCRAAFGHLTCISHHQLSWKKTMNHFHGCRNGSSNFTRHIYTWNPTDPCFDRKRPYFGWLVVQNRGHSGSRYIYIQISLYMWAGLPSTLYEKEHGWLCFDGCQDLHEAGARGVLGSAHVGFGAQMEFH